MLMREERGQERKEKKGLHNKQRVNWAGTTIVTQLRRPLVQIIALEKNEETNKCPFTRAFSRAFSRCVLG